MLSKKERRLVAEALKLPSEARAALAGKLLDNLDEGVDEDAEEAWSKEIGRRVGELKTGAVKTLPWSEVRRAILHPANPPLRGQRRTQRSSRLTP